MELFKYELKKIFLNRIILILLIVLTLLNIAYFGVAAYNNRISSRNMYISVKDFNGQSLNDIGNIVDPKIKEFENNNSGTKSILRMDAQERFKIIEYYKIMNLNGNLMRNQINISEANSKIGITSGFEQKKNMLFISMMNSAWDGTYHYTGGWDNIVGFVFSPGAIIMAVLILLGLSSMFSNEYSTRMDSVILSTRFGKTKLINIKILSSVVYIFIVNLFFNLLNLIGNLIIYGAYGWDAPVQCLSKYTGSPFKFTVLQYYSLELIISLAACIVFGFFILLISSISQTQILAFFLGAVMFVIPIIINNSINIKSTLADTIINFSFTWFMQVERLFNYFKVYNFIDQPIHYPVVLSVFMIFVAIICCFAMKKNFRNHGVGF